MFPLSDSPKTMQSTTLPAFVTSSQYSPTSRLWIYLAERPLTAQECTWAEEELKQFTDNWTAHNAALKATAEIWNQQAILLLVDESQAGASGCSIDKSVRFLEQLGASLKIDLFDRMRFAWIDEQCNVRFNTLQELPALVKAGIIQQESLMINTLVKTLKEMEEQCLVPLHSSWQARFV